MKRCTIHKCPILPIGDHHAVCVAAYGQHLEGIPITDFFIHDQQVNLVFSNGCTYPLLGWESADHAQNSSGAADGLLDVIEGNYLVETICQQENGAVTLVIGDRPEEGQWQLHLKLDHGKAHDSLGQT
jgi:hypothetical protein